MKKKMLLPKTTYFEGGPRGIILLHAYTGSPNDVRSLGRYLNNEGYSVLLPLFSGHGTMRPEDILEEGPDSWLKDLEDSINWMKEQGFEQVAIMGLSMGGMFAMKGIISYPDYVIGGGPMCTPLNPGASTNIIPTFLDYAQFVMKKDGATESEIVRRLPSVKEKQIAQLSELNSFINEIFDNLPHVTQQILLVQAGKDQMMNPDDVYVVEEQLKQSESEVKWYPESGHVITVGPEKKQLQEDILVYLNNLKWCH
ncbi:alpha/beta hydrolase [Vagococcus intermedius]|uniref:Alpha/beta fold hydrolase n=1 Tax=Vagococcus intermedius TaxID=2991418 RepID=A0AAF0I8L2_9ENTE|nr:alpha/beta fold hydrolase [Vagococcus intermedius]WEG74086.1 alpha/beta fold hydrolase [Vagococcus intermedius]WEG76166.1 alpha/beta fold hydrolase [Vagococcus intermedius]